MSKCTPPVSGYSLNVYGGDKWGGREGLGSSRKLTKGRPLHAEMNMKNAD